MLALTSEGGSERQRGLRHIDTHTHSVDVSTPRMPAKFIVLFILFLPLVCLLKSGVQCYAQHKLELGVILFG